MKIQNSIRPVEEQESCILTINMNNNHQKKILRKRSGGGGLKVSKVSKTALDP